MTGPKSGRRRTAPGAGRPRARTIVRRWAAGRGRDGFRGSPIHVDHKGAG
jgi:hypothetical protein